MDFMPASGLAKRLHGTAQDREIEMQRVKMCYTIAEWVIADVAQTIGRYSRAEDRSGRAEFIDMRARLERVQRLVTGDSGKYGYEPEMWQAVMVRSLSDPAANVVPSAQWSFVVNDIFMTLASMCAYSSDKLGWRWIGNYTFNVASPFEWLQRDIKGYIWYLKLLLRDSTSYTEEEVRKQKRIESVSDGL